MFNPEKIRTLKYIYLLIYRFSLKFHLYFQKKTKSLVLRDIATLASNIRENLFQKTKKKNITQNATVKLCEL